tara:strand:+ start:102 stop:500 length:399 start_codon:yes stop_codon:yes gene_type:complete
MKKKIITTVVIVLVLMFWAVPVKAADTKDVIAGIVIGGIIGSEIQKGNQKQKEEVIGTIIMPDGTLVIPDTKREREWLLKPFDPRRSSIHIGDWRWDRYKGAWMYFPSCKDARDYEVCRLTKGRYNNGWEVD